MREDGCPDEETMPDTPAALIEWAVGHLGAAKHRHSRETFEDTVRDLVVLHAYVSPRLLVDIYDAGRAYGMKYHEFSDRAGPNGRGYWTDGHQVHSDRHRSLQDRFRRVASRPSGVRSTTRSQPRQLEGFGELAEAARQFLRARNGFRAPADSDFLLLTCEDLEAEAAPPPGIPIDSASLHLAAACAVQDLADLRIARVFAGERPEIVEASYSPDARKALDRLKAAMAGHGAP